MRNKVKSLFFIIVLLASACSCVIIFQTLDQTYPVLRAILAILLILTLGDAIYYAICGKNIGALEDSFPPCSISHSKQKSLWLIVPAVLILIYSPIITQNFFFHDDYINFIGESGNNFFEYTFSQGRQLTGLLTDLMSYVSPDTSWHLRIISVLGLIIYALMLYQIIYHLTSSLKKAIFFSICMSAITPVVNVVSYGSMFCYSLAFVCSCSGILHFRNYLLHRENRIFHFLLGMESIILANFIYQATATVAFTIIMLFIIFPKEEHKSKYLPVKLIGLFVFSTAIYYILTKLFSYIYGISLMNRGNMISDFQDIVNKFFWFITVCIENIKQLISSILGNNLFDSIWQHYILYFKNNIFSMIIIAFFALFIILGLTKIYTFSKWLGLLQALILIPLSYYVFLILAENSYTSYYSVALCSTLFLLFVLGIEFAYDKICCFCHITYLPVTKHISTAFAALLLFLFLWNANYYMRTFWVEYNSVRYNYLKNYIACNYENESRIHTVGTLYPGQADVYTVSASQLACKELEIPIENIRFTSSSNDKYIATLSLEVFDMICEKLPKSEQNFMNKVYTVDYDFSICYLNPGLEDDDYILLEKIFKDSGYIPDKNDENTLFIDMQNLLTYY